MSHFTKAERFVAELFEVKSDALPPRYRYKKSTRKLSSVISQFERFRPHVDPNEVSVKFDAEGNMSGTRERLERLQAYRQQIENGAEEISYIKVNHGKFTDAACAFLNIMEVEETVEESEVYINDYFMSNRED